MKRLSLVTALVVVLTGVLVLGGCEKKRDTRAVVVAAGLHETPVERLKETAVNVATAEYLEKHVPFAYDLYTEAWKAHAKADVVQSVRVSDLEEAAKKHIGWNRMTGDREVRFRDLFGMIRYELEKELTRIGAEEKLEGYVSMKKLFAWIGNAAVPYCPNICVVHH